MKNKFNENEAIKNLKKIENSKKEDLEHVREQVLEKEKYTILLAYLDKQIFLIKRLFDQVKLLKLNIYESRYVFALKTQQLYTAIEDLLKQVAKAFENHIQDLSSFNGELLIRLNTDIPRFRPAVIKKETFLFLNKLHTFRQFIWHSYDCELDEKELHNIQSKLKSNFHLFLEDFATFREYVVKLSQAVPE